MGIMEEIKGRIESLSAAEQAELRAWFVERDNQLWDEEIASDLAAGKLDRLIAEAKADRAAGKAREL
jgi:hypothetical protein